MARLRVLLPFVLALAACGSGRDVFQPYDSCNRANDLGDDSRFDCEQSELPSVSFTGAFCTVGCGQNSDCPLVINNFDTICVNSQCFIQCPGSGNNCPYGQGCFDFTDADTGDILSLCTP